MRGVQQEYAGRIDVTRVNILNGENAALLKEFAFGATPEFYLVDQNGEIVGFWNGPVEADELRAAFDRVLN